jgi:hypothetical protein
VVDIHTGDEDKVVSMRVNTDARYGATTHGSVEMCHNSLVDKDHGMQYSVELFGHSGVTTSMSIHEETQRVAMTWLADSSHSGIAIIPMDGITTTGSPREFSKSFSSYFRRLYSNRNLVQGSPQLSWVLVNLVARRWMSSPLVPRHHHLQTSLHLAQVMV